jgi:stage II sporulation protein D
MLVVPLHDTLAVINRLGLEDYLRGVVAVEMGNRPASDSAALQAQAVASRSYAVLRLGGSNAYDLRASVADQAYGGFDAENPGANAAVDATRGLVLRHGGRTVDAPYSSTCGGTTAEAPEVWRTAGAAYLRRVSDRVGSTSRYYCDIAPRYRWTREFDGSQLQAVLDRYLRAYAAVPRDGPGRARRVTIGGRTASGRVATLQIDAASGAYAVQRHPLRTALAEWRDTPQHVFFRRVRPGTRWRDRAPDRARSGKRTWGRYVPVGRDRAFARRALLPRDPRYLLPGNQHCHSPVRSGSA